MEIFAEITGLKYKPFLCRKFRRSDFFHFKKDELKEALKRKSFILKFNNNESIALSRWVSPKRTRSYPYAAVYDTFGFTGKIATIIPVIISSLTDRQKSFFEKLKKEARENNFKIKINNIFLI